jgi:hypothetical protein
MRKEVSVKVNIQKEIEVHHITDGKAYGWVHTHGLAKHNQPELEIRHIPLFMGPAATIILNNIADYMLNGGGELKLGQTIKLGPRTAAKLAKLPPITSALNHYQEERWALVDLEELKGKCSCCEGRVDA